MEQITRRQAENSDFEFAKKVHHLAYHDVVVKQFGSWVEKMQDGFFEKSWKPETHEIIFYGENPVGYCSVQYNLDHIFLSELVLEPEFQGKGIGSRILEDLIVESNRAHIPVRLHVFKKNQARDLYRRFGFQDIKEGESNIEMEYNPNN